jgi:type IV pilus modification protein PilV
LIAAPERRVAGARHRGFGLIEVLVALAISATGLLGEALLLRHCLAAQGAALRREQATALLSGITEQVRMNAVACADYALPAGAPSPAAPACASGAGCAPTMLAAADLAQWLDDIAATLPAAPGAPGAATIDYAPAAGGDRLDLTLYWGEPGATAPVSMSLSLLLAGAAP